VSTHVPQPTHFPVATTLFNNESSKLNLVESTDDHLDVRMPNLRLKLLEQINSDPRARANGKFILAGTNL
jgi:hypothetical protein